ncbi:UDP-N-acetylmuramoyl-tripeptide--D-alanyl-D-alanine ligase [Candidatus Oleimmundimicrobium sp.]|uniref:UDP-N-acetylmuramoyl-tripeptide--D-alanyl-D- alanine ligase n=1 Tax=Candidatus Oleimmundimicrobium sp. TaxID=3060597 RepID=UPI0027283715|nr:UDP-N-acetylmuramoyl-tripeptide--D-alanyl-D-alanine ligase [Candidatus Oleimmundimicrobium sp.]MDO8885505.1 UDP-N-acetylmuramoyl-tripeptide--D-alanyl-D-alanine ligase [Candidatus Oleimmundimicrobium sp.]
MLKIGVSELISILPSAELIFGSSDCIISSICTDTRFLKEGDFFIPLKGERFDGHKFIEDAVKKGASGFFTEHWNEQMEAKIKAICLPSDFVIIKVQDSLKALQLTASLVRKKLNCQVIGITGSTGKTITKDMIGSILKKKFSTVYSEKNYNNEIGVPLTIIKADSNTDVLILELGMRGKGQIAELCEIALPTIGLITNIGKAHFELLRSEEAIARTKAELVKSIPSNGVVVLNCDDGWTSILEKMTSAKIIKYGLSRKADIRAEGISVDASGCPSFKIIYENNSAFLKLSFPGRHNIYNALAAASVAIVMGLSLEDIKDGLEKCEITEMRMQVFKNSKGVTIINDAYNANPDSMRASLESLKEIECKERRVAILGDMAELGEISLSSHKDVGALVKKKGVDLLFTVGEKAKQIARGAIEIGMDAKNVFICNNLKDAELKVKKVIKSGDVVLVKGSRIMELEKLIHSIS